MMKPLIRVTQLESFRRYMSGEYSYVTEQDVIDNITKKFEGNDYTRIGTAFHSIVETGSPHCFKEPEGVRHFTYYKKDKTEPVPKGRRFVFDEGEAILDIPQCKVALKYRNEHPGAFHEVREYKDFGDAVITGCADMIDGLEIRDIKTKYGPVSDKDYIDSCQWQLYLELFEADVFHFDLFVFEGYNKDKHKGDVRGLKLTPYEPAITCYRYPEMEDKNHALLREFLKWVEMRELLPYLPLTESDG